MEFSLYPVIIGIDFWHRITGFTDFYSGLVTRLNTLIDSLNYDNSLEKGYQNLLEEVKKSGMF